MTQKTYKRGEKHIIEGMYLTLNHVFWATIHENWLKGLGCTLGNESKNIKKSQYLYMSLLRGDAQTKLIKTKISTKNVKSIGYEL